MYSVKIYLGIYRNKIYFKYYKTENALATRMHVTKQLWCRKATNIAMYFSNEELPVTELETCD